MPKHNEVTSFTVKGSLGVEVEVPFEDVVNAVSGYLELDDGDEFDNRKETKKRFVVNLVDALFDSNPYFIQRLNEVLNIYFPRRKP
jgi:hypothetical protein